MQRVWLLLIALALSPGGASGQPLLEVSHFGINLSMPVLNLWREVENKFGKPIREGATNAEGAYGMSGVDEDGTPWIQLSARGRDEETLSHELMHLNILLDGYAKLSFEIPAGRGTPELRNFLPWFSFHVRDSVLHWMFYPRLQRMGLHPDAQLAKDFREAMAHDEFRGVMESANPEEILATYYFQFITLLSDQQLRDEFAAWYRRKGWTAAMDRGNKAAEILFRKQPATPREEMATFVECANELVNSFRLEERKWTSRAQGNVDIQSVVVGVVAP